jgi:hypothetical protein
MKKLFMEVPSYELIQVQTYLQIVPIGAQKAKVIEQYQETTNTNIVIRDDMLWKEEILPGLLKFCSDLNEAMTGKE